MASSDSRSLVDERYELERRIARGGGGTVWLAHDRSLDRQVALKEVELPDELPTSERAGAKERVLREAKAAARLRHPGVVTVFDVLDGADTVHLVMELVEAPTLRQVIDEQGPLSEEEAARLALPLLEILETAHRHGIVHRDVKPSNVFVHADGEPQLADFGIASLAGETSLTLTGTALGSPDYLAPEQAQGATPAPEADLWGLGATLYFAVEGVTPFQRAGVIPTVQAVVNDPPRPYQRADRLAGVIDGLLEKDPADRPSPDELRARLRAVAEADGTVDAGAPTQTTQRLSAAAPPAAAARDDGALDRDQGTAADETDGGEDALAQGPAATARDETDETDGGEDALAQGPAATARDETDGAADAPEHGPSIATGAEEGPRRRAPALVAGLVVAVLAVAGAGLWLAGGPDEPAGEVAEAPTETDDEGAPQGGADADAEATGSGSGAGAEDAQADGDDEATPSTDDTSQQGIEEADGIPDDWQTMTGPTYEVAVPPDWQERAASGNRTDYVDPSSGAYLRVDHTDDPAPDPLADWETAAADFADRHDGYEEIRLERADYRDYDAAVWEYRYRDGGATLRAVNINIVDGDHAYALNLQSDEARWDEVGGQLPFMTAGFHPAR
jgi:eukaryotic-like serine/threonine-protein kinase